MDDFTRVCHTWAASIEAAKEILLNAESKFRKEDNSPATQASGLRVAAVAPAIAGFEPPLFSLAAEVNRFL